MKVAVLGTGFGSHHVFLYKQQPEIDEIIVWGRSEEKLNALKDKYQVEITTDMDKIFERSDIDLIDVCTPSETHKEYALKALNSGKHVYCETPVTYSVSEAEEILDASIKNNKKAMVDLFIRFEYQNEFLQKAISESKYGSLRSFRIYRETAPWWGALGKEYIVTDLMLHDIDYTTWILGYPQNISLSHNFISEREGVVDINLQYNNTIVNIFGSSMMSDSHPFSIGYEAIFDKAVIRYYEDYYNETKMDKKLMLYTDDKYKEIEFEPAHGSAGSLKHVIKAIKNDETPINDIRQAITSLKLAYDIKKRIQ